jgi:RimJ/RimL family protein N-acetyltransferase
MSLLTPVKAEHADALYALLKHSAVTDTLRWDGPASLEDLRESLREREMQTAAGQKHMFTILAATGEPIGCADIFVTGERKAEIGLWIGEPFQGMGIGSEVVEQLTAYGFERLPIDEITSEIFVGNTASRRAFEKCGYELTSTLKNALTKRGVEVDAWMLTRRRRKTRHRREDR